jgi:hypothetical protein
MPGAPHNSRARCANKGTIFYRGKAMKSRDELLTTKRKIEDHLHGLGFIGEIREMHQQNQTLVNYIFEPGFDLKVGAVCLSAVGLLSTIGADCVILRSIVDGKDGAVCLEVHDKKVHANEGIFEIQRANDIVSVISEHVKLTKSGENYTGLCPFHSEESQSFKVSSELQIFHCFSCRKSGDVIAFVQYMNGVSFNEAINILSSRLSKKIS